MEAIMKKQADYIKRIEIKRLWGTEKYFMGLASRCKYPERNQRNREKYHPEQFCKKPERP